MEQTTTLWLVQMTDPWGRSWSDTYRPHVNRNERDKDSVYHKEGGG